MMPDLTIQHARWCGSNELFSTCIEGSNGKSYFVGYILSTGWHCDCKGFKFRKTCTHVKQAEKLRCGYGWEAAAGSPIEMGKKCPECGGGTTVMSYAV